MLQCAYLLKNCVPKSSIDIRLSESESFSFSNTEIKMILAIIKSLVPIKANVDGFLTGRKFVHCRRCHNFYVKKAKR